MITQVARNFLTFWCDARGDTLVPVRSDIHLERLEDISSRVLYSAWDDQNKLVIHYAGTELISAFGTDVTGVDQMDFSHPEELELSKLTLGLVGNQPCGLIAAITLRGEGHIPRQFECIYLPVAHEGRNTYIVELVNPLTVDYQSDDGDGPMQALRYSDRSFIDIGAGTPPPEGPLAPYGACILEDLLQT